MDTPTAPTRELVLLTVYRGRAETFPLPAEGELTIGRDDSAELKIDLPNVSRQHARLHLGEAIYIEDLGSANGTRLREQRLDSHVKVPVEVGQVIEVDTALLIVQSVLSSRVPRRPWPYDAFALRLEEACQAGHRPPLSAFGLVRLSVAPASASLLERAFTTELDDSVVLGAYSPGSYALIVFEPARSPVDIVVDRIATALAWSGVELKRGLCMFPTDGRSAHALIARANEALAQSTEPTCPLIVRSSATKDLLRVLEQLAKGRGHVALVGESGTGKTHIAAHYHQVARQAEGQLITLACSALNPAQLESELFGGRGEAGRLEREDHTIVLEEVQALPEALQARVARAAELDEIAARLVCTSDVDLRAEMAAGRLREDFYLQILSVRLRVAPLRARPEEIVPLAASFLAAATRPSPAPRLSAAAKGLLIGYDWPGNVRELRNLMVRAIHLGATEEIHAEHLRPLTAHAPDPAPPHEPNSP